MSKRIYKVVSPDGTYLVNAANKSQAIRKIADKIIGADVATQQDLVALLKAGTEILEVADNAEQGELL